MAKAAGRRIYDATGMMEIAEKQRVMIRRGGKRGQVGILQFVRRSTSHIRIYVVTKDGNGIWLSPRAVDVLP